MQCLSAHLAGQLLTWAVMGCAVGCALFLGSLQTPHGTVKSHDASECDPPRARRVSAQVLVDVGTGHGIE
jgi:hypothetical protein